MKAALFVMTHCSGRTMNSPFRPMVCVEAFPVVPTKANSAVPSCFGGGGGGAAAAGAWANAGSGRQSSAQSKAIFFTVRLLVNPS